jgi:hypothetical protein
MPEKVKMEYWSDGVVEQWNEETACRDDNAFSNTPVLQYSINQL